MASINEKKNRLSSTMEDYLEAILWLKKKNEVARVRDISRQLEVKTSSVTTALKTLSNNGLILHEKYGYVDLTPEGERLASGVQNRHNLLLNFLTEILGIAPNVAEKDACKMEHGVSPQTLERLAKFIEFVERSPSKGKPQWLKGFDHYFKTGRHLQCSIGRAGRTSSG